jgi:hypothetical protein
MQEDGGRGTVINYGQDQAKLLQYWAWARQDIAVAIALPMDNYATGYWMNLKLDPIPEDDEGRPYAELLRQMRLEKLQELSPRIVAGCDNLDQNFSHKMRYQSNALKIWFTPTVHMFGGLDKPLAEAPVPKCVCLLSSAPVGFVPSPRITPHLAPPTLGARQAHTLHPASDYLFCYLMA